MTEAKLQPIVMEDRRILFRNFSGEPGRFNALGQRNFNVLLFDAEAEAMAADGWNVKYLQPREEGDTPQARLEVAVHFGKNPPRVVLITSKGKTLLDESMVSLLDWADIVTVDLIVRPYQWEVQGRRGVKAYLKAIYVTIREDPLELKYIDVPDSAASAITEPHEEGPPWDEEK
jgi:hypothetical protein